MHRYLIRDVFDFFEPALGRAIQRVFTQVPSHDCNQAIVARSTSTVVYTVDALAYSTIPASTFNTTGSSRHVPTDKLNAAPRFGTSRQKQLLVMRGRSVRPKYNSPQHPTRPFPTLLRNFPRCCCRRRVTRPPFGPWWPSCQLDHLRRPSKRAVNPRTTVA